MEECRICLALTHGTHSVWEFCGDIVISDLVQEFLQVEVLNLIFWKTENYNFSLSPQIFDQDELPQRICCRCLEILNNVNTLRQIAKHNSEILLSGEAALDPTHPTHHLHLSCSQFTQQSQSYPYQSSAGMFPHHFIQMPAVYNANPVPHSNRNVPWYPPVVVCPHSESDHSNWQVSVDENCEESRLSTRANQFQWKQQIQTAAENLDSTFETFDFASQEASAEKESADKEIVYFIVFKPQDSVWIWSKSIAIHRKILISANFIVNWLIHCVTN